MVYFVPKRGVYEVAAGLSPLGTDHGAGVLDQQVFQFGRAPGDEEPWLRNKQVGRAEQLDRYVRTAGFEPALEQSVCDWMLDRLRTEHPGRRFDDGVPVGFVGRFDHLCSQVCEDVAVMAEDASGTSRVVALSLFAPNHWSAEDKVGGDFRAIHAPVAGMQRILATTEALLDVLVHRGPFVRFAWGIATDTRLNHHPLAPRGVEEAQWQGRSFDPVPRTRLQLPWPEVLPQSTAPLFLRVERQVLVGLPRHRAFVFTIRTWFLDGDAVRADPEQNRPLCSALESMGPEVLRYKGLERSRGAILVWLREGRGAGPKKSDPA